MKMNTGNHLQMAIFQVCEILSFTYIYLVDGWFERRSPMMSVDVFYWRLVHALKPMGKEAQDVGTEVMGTQTWPEIWLPSGVIKHRNGKYIYWLVFNVYIHISYPLVIKHGSGRYTNYLQIYRWLSYWSISSGFPIATFDYRRVNGGVHVKSRRTKWGFCSFVQFIRSLQGGAH